MASSSSSPLSPTPPRFPSSSANTIPVAGKSILKRPPQQPQSLFSRISKFLPAQAQPHSGQEEARPLKRAHFILPEIAIVYPISSVNPPTTPTLRDERRAIEERELERRRRVLRAHSVDAAGDETEQWWPMDKVESFYRECCAGCDENPDPAISSALKHAALTTPRTVDFSGAQLTLVKSSILSDVFSIEWGLRKVVFRECDLDEYVLKPILHSLLLPGTLTFLSVASNRRLKTAAFRLLGAYLKQAKSLQFLDISQNPIDKKSIEYIVASLAPAPEQGLVSLRMDDCLLRPAVLETLCRAVRTSSLRNISLRHNRISASGGVALALMIRDYPDVVPTPLSPAPSSASWTPVSSAASSPTSSVINLPAVVTPATASPSLRSGALPPAPPRHPPVGLQTTYTPYVPRARRGRHTGIPTTATSTFLTTGQHVPLITSSSQGGVTTRHTVSPSPATASHPDGSIRHDAGPSAALLDKVRALDSLPRLGALRTLDLRGNDLRTGITYLAQVLKRNRTLKLLNLSENKLDVQCLVIVAEALKYNSCLETLDLNKNPCCGPGLEGIQSLRTAFTLNSALKRLFLSSTNMNSPGAIALAEFLPESTSLLHLDLTNNNLDIAGVMALSSGLKANHVMRCLDVNIPPGDEEFASMCRDILNTCIRNTEDAERSVRFTQDTASQNNSGRGLGKGVWNMIEESELAKSIRLDEEKKTETDIVVRGRSCVADLGQVIAGSEKLAPVPRKTEEETSEIVPRTRAIVAELATAIQETEDPVRLEELVQVNDQLLSLLKKLPANNQGKPSLTLRGLGLSLNGNITSTSPNGYVNGSAASSDDSTSSIDSRDGVYGDDTPTTPRIDKGKRRADPEPVEIEKVLSPSILVSESEDEEDSGYGTPPEIVEGMPSPTDRSRSWVAEEGEVFRKGQVLLGPKEMEGEYAGEDLRKELLEAQLERPPPRPITDDFGLEILPPTADPCDETSAPPTPIIEDAPKPQPRPYISRSRSSASSILRVPSPTLGSDSGPSTPTQSSPILPSLTR